MIIVVTDPLVTDESGDGDSREPEIMIRYAREAMAKKRGE